MAGRFVVDNSVVMAWCFDDESGDYAEQVLDQLVEADALVPTIWPLEVANVILVAERNKRLSGADSRRFLELLSSLPIAVDHDSARHVLSDVLTLGREYGLSSYDASYLDLAMRYGVPIATLDKSLRKAARRCNVELV